MSLATAGLEAPNATQSANEGLPNPNKALWEKGDFTRLAACMRESGEELIAGISVTAGLEVLDLGCGDGTTALPLAARGARVLGVDIAANLVAAGTVRAAQAGLANLRFEEGDASHLDSLEDDRFALVVSMFGAMFAPRPFDTAKEMVRVTRPGGRIVMGNWIPGDPTLIARVLQICAGYTPAPPSGFVSPVSWGQEAAVRERFGAAGIADGAITCERATWTFRHAGPPRDFLAIFRDFYGPTMNAFEAAERSGRRAELQRELEVLFEAENQAGPQRTEIPATYLKVVVQA
jgi:SAM-dependent methyltransferase